MLSQIAKPKASSSTEKKKEIDEKTSEANDAKLLPWLTVTDSFRGVMRSTCTLDPMSHVGNFKLCFNKWAKFKLQYRDTRFIERDTIFIRLSSKIASDFNDTGHFVKRFEEQIGGAEHVCTSCLFFYLVMRGN